MPADLQSNILLILLTGSDTVVRLWPYVAGGILAALLILRLVEGHNLALPANLPRPLPRGLAVPAAAVGGAVSPLPTAGVVPVLLARQTGARPAPAALAFAIASLLINPQIFVLTLGALGVPFALTQLAAALALSVLLGFLFGRTDAQAASGAEDGSAHLPTPTRFRALDLTAHVVLYFLIGATVGAALQVLLPQTGLLGWLADHGLLSSPLIGWLAAPFYTCGGSAVPLAGSLGRTGVSMGALFAFLLAGPALRATSLASLGCLLPRRSLLLCVAALLILSGLLGVGIDWLQEVA